MDPRFKTDDTEGLPADLDAELDSLLRECARDGTDLTPLPQPGQLIGDKYRIEASLGNGAMGAVFRATNVLSQKSVALKWMLAPTNDERAQQRFIREARVAGRIDHPNVVDVYDIGRDSQSWYLVMELLRGESLRARLRRDLLTVRETIDLLLPAMRGVAAVHRAGVIHRDLKPDNIFLCTGPDDEPREAKVLDFGVSAITSTPDDPTLTESGTLLGTPAYMSPEQLQCARIIDVRSDIYSFGVILYEALTGEVPFAADSYPGLILAIVNTPPKPPSALRPELPRELSAIVLRALSKDREARQPSMETLMTELEALARRIDSQPDLHRLASAAAPRIRAMRWAALAAAALIGLALWLTFGNRTRPPASIVRPLAVEANTSAPSPSAGSNELPTATMSETEDPLTRLSDEHGVAPPPLPEDERNAAPKRDEREAPKLKPHPAIRNHKQPMAAPGNEKPARQPSCDPPYEINAAGHLIFRPECRDYQPQ